MVPIYGKFLKQFLTVRAKNEFRKLHEQSHYLYLGIIGLFTLSFTGLPIVPMV